MEEARLRANGEKESSPCHFLLPEGQRKGTRISIGVRGFGPATLHWVPHLFFLILPVLTHILLTEGATGPMLLEPLVDTFCVELVLTRQDAHLVACFPVTLAYRA